ncbi:MAG TPA: SurA N-terminal domain-containing protein [Steroidobacteraceae bacterium]|nr:SurA N-terminal domain-containing protein [Steroidobacteraceae bacterium]
MLQSIRDKTSGWVAALLLGAVALVFVFFGMDFQSSAARSYAAKVNGESISAETVRRAWQNQLSRLQQMMRGELPPELMKQQREALLDQFVRSSLLSQRVRDQGYRVSDHALAERITSIPQLQVDGKFSKDRYTALLMQNGRSEAQFEAELRGELETEQLQAGIIDSAFITPVEADRRYALEQEAREIDYALLPVNAFLDAAQVTDAQAQQWYTEHKDQYQTPERADIEYIELTRADAEAAVKVDEAALRDYYEKVKDRFEAPERRRARHILIPTGEGNDAAAAEKLANEVAAKVTAGGDFAALAKQYSKDPGSAEQGGDLGWAQRGMFVGPFEEALFAMKPGEIRGPVKSEFGYHIIKLEEIEPAKVKSFDEARTELENEYRRDQSQQIFYDRSQELADTSFAALTELRSVGEKLKLPVKTVTGFTREGGGALGREPDVIKAVFSDDVLQSRQNSPLIAIGEDRAIVLRVAKHEPAKPQPLEQVRPQIEAQLKQQAARAAAAKQGAEALKRLQTGAPWAQVTADLKIAPVGKRTIQRHDSSVPTEVVELAFAASAPKSADAPQFAGAATADGGYALVALSQIAMPDPKSEAAEARNARVTQAARQRGNEEFGAYLGEIQRNAKIVRNPAVLE